MEEKDKKKKPQSHEDLEGFDIRINEFGEIITNYDVDNLNDFLNENLEDKKLAQSQSKEEEE